MHRLRKKPARRRLQRQAVRPEDVVPITDPMDHPLYTITLSNPRTGRDCVISLFPGTRPGNLRVMVNGDHQPALETQTQLMAWLRRRLPRTSAKRMTEER